MGRHSPANGHDPAASVLTHTPESRHPGPALQELARACEQLPTLPLTHHSRSRVAERAEARSRAKRARFRRLSTVPVTCAVLSTFFANDAYHLIAPPASATERTGVTGPNDLSALAASAGTSGTGYAASFVAGGLGRGADEPIRVSRFRRNAITSGASSQTVPLAAQAFSFGTQAVSLTTRPDALGALSDEAPLPARPGMPKVDPYKTVAGTWVRPSAGGMSTCFCMRWGVFHEGIDLAGPLGSPIVATGDGVVLEAGPAAGFGHWIVIQQSNGDVTIYGHMFTVLVGKGDHVTAGQHIADIGDDGEATGPHLHFGVRQGGINGPYIDPVPWLRARGVSVGSYDPNA